jgi:hypothetical protein
MDGDRVPPQALFGRVRGHYVYPGNQDTVYLFRLKKENRRLLLPGDWLSQGEDSCNLIMYQWAAITGELLRGAPDRRLYNLSAMYIEFENNGGAAVSPPTNDDRGNGRAYYDSLLNDATRDYLRVPMTAVTLESTDDELYPDGNKVTCFAQTTGAVGVHGKPFNDSAPSRVYGGALVAAPKFSDATQDMVFSRFYFSTAAKQLVKLANSQVGLKWPITLL